MPHRSRCCASISTTSSRSTTPWAIRPATSSLSGSLGGSLLLWRITGIVARLGGDEFAVLIEGSVEESQAAAHRVLESFSAAIVIDGVPVEVRPSIGFTMATAGSSCTVDQLLRHADLAMYAAKREGGKCIRSFVPDLPFPYAFPEFTDSAISAANSLPVGTAGNQTRWQRTLLPGFEVATSTPDKSNDAPNAIRWPPLAIRIALAVLAIGVIAFTASSVLNPNAGHSVFFADFLYPALNLLAAALIAVRAYRVTADRLAWILIAAGMACSAMGDVVYALWVPDGQSPSVADPAYLAFYPLVYAGLLLLMRARLKRVPRSDPARFPGLRVDHGRGGRGADGRAHPRGGDPRTGNRAGGPALSVGRSGPAGSGRRHAANPQVGATSFAGSFWSSDLFCLRWRTRRISSRPPPAHTGLAACSMPAGPRRHYWWRWPAGRLRRRWYPYRDADSAPTSSLWRALSWRLQSPSWVTTHDSRRLSPR